MKPINKIVIGIIVGLIVGLPKGMRDLPRMIADDLPQDTFLLIAVLGGIGGLLFGMKLLSRADRKAYSVGMYFFLLISSFSIGIPTVLRHYDSDLVKDLTIAGLFFSSIGFAMILGGVISYVFSKKNNKYKDLHSFRSLGYARRVPSFCGRNLYGKKL